MGKYVPNFRLIIDFKFKENQIFLFRQGLIIGFMVFSLECYRKHNTFRLISNNERVLEQTSKLPQISLPYYLNP